MPDGTPSRPALGPCSQVQVQFTIDDPALADEMVGRLLVERLVACGQRVGPVVSRYWWRGTLERADEWLVLLKTRAELASVVVDAVVAAHPYETPEVVVLGLEGGAPGYLAWIDEITEPATTTTIRRTGPIEER